MPTASVSLPRNPFPQTYGSARGEEGQPDSQQEQPPAGQLKYNIHGFDLQFVEITLGPKQTMIAEPGAMMFKSPQITMNTSMGDGSGTKQGFFGNFFSNFLSGAKRAFAGESLFLSHFTNNTAQAADANTTGATAADANTTGATAADAKIAFAAPYPSHIKAINLSEMGTFFCQRGAFLCAQNGTKIEFVPTKRFSAGLLGGKGFILQKLTGPGIAFVHAGGTVTERELGIGETLEVDTGCVVGFTEGIDYNITTVEGVKSAAFGGEGLFLATLTGNETGKETGKRVVYLQSLPLRRMAKEIVAAAPRARRQ